MTSDYVYLRLVHTPVETHDNGGPQKRSGRGAIAVQVVRGDEVVGYLGGVKDVRLTYDLAGFATAELEVIAFHQAIEDVRWPSTLPVVEETA